MMQDDAASMALLDTLIETLTDVLDVRKVFDRVSTIAQPILRHDIMGVIEPSDDGKLLKLYATAGSDAVPRSFEEPNHHPELLASPWEFFIVDDLLVHPVYKASHAAKVGMRSALSIPLRFGGRLQAVVNFFRKDVASFSAADVPFAKRIGRYIALAMSHHRLAERAADLQAREALASDRALRLESRVRQLTDELDARSGYRRVLGNAPAWRQVLLQATQVAPTETTVLLLGETGTGKEVVARFVHRASARRDKPFVALNCAALPEHLLEAELFGYERGAFTGATQTKLGQIEQAAGGMLFLDEVGEMTLAAQAKLLRVLQEREFQRLGGQRVLKADIRVVAATNRDLRKAIERGSFREDLYYRLHVFPIAIPPLRDRREDVLPMAEAFIQEIGRTLGRPPSGISRDARQTLIDYHWPGNVRELRNVLERAAILADGGLVVSEHLALAPPGRAQAAGRSAPVSTPSGDLGAPSDLPSLERTTIEKALADARFNKSIAAKALGLSRGQLYTRLKRYGLS